MSASARWAFVVIVGLGGVAILLYLGVWQTQRLVWKQGVLAELTERLDAPPLFVTGLETPEAHNFRRAVADGEYVQGVEPVRFLTSLRPFGPGHRVIYPFELRRGGRILVDRGFVKQGAAPTPPPLAQVGAAGVLHWPRERGFFTPEANKAEQLWFARDVDEMAAHFGALPVLLVLNENPSRSPIAVPVSVDVPNNHLGYAITWFSLAVVWVAMTVIFVRRGARVAAPAADAPGG